MDQLATITNVKTLKERLIYARELRGLSQGDLAKKAKCAQSTIGNVESGARSTLRNLIDVARALECSSDWLYDGKGPKPVREDTTYGSHTTTPLLASDNVVAVSSSSNDKLRQELLDLFSHLDAPSQTEWLNDLRGFVRGRRPHPNGQALPLAGKK
jgi:transcriptional regulator with XRE-family HTH domain